MGISRPDRIGAGQPQAPDSGKVDRSGRQRCQIAIAILSHVAEIYRSRSLFELGDRIQLAPTGSNKVKSAALELAALSGAMPFMAVSRANICPRSCQRCAPSHDRPAGHSSPPSDTGAVATICRLAASSTGAATGAKVRSAAKLMAGSRASAVTVNRQAGCVMGYSFVAGFASGADQGVLVTAML